MKTFKKEVKLNVGFTLLELLVVVAIIGLLSAVVLAALGNARNSGKDAGVKSNLKNAMDQAEIFWNTSSPNTYFGVCTSTTGIGTLVAAAASDSVAGNSVGSAGGQYNRATCHDSVGAWAAEVPLSASASGSPVMWCVDSTGKSKQETTNLQTNGSYQYACQ